ncbi:MAG: SoxR reducing system RseC family protein [Candidatus Cloacimonetes bacterium]|nr:SoxR reducing system RseC family protein [Candidatus Cloacimonadota bacterium]MBS3767055.1 SoxR reducing system RseC family protein [Candidatus Cloacimonadota bacterium]
MASKQQKEYNTGKVVKLQNNNAIVEITDNDACGSCGLKSFCIQNTKENIQLEIKNTQNAKIGDVVKFEISPGIKILSNFYVFILPLLVIIATYFIAKDLLLLSEDFSIILSVLSLILSYFIIKHINRVFKKNKTIKVKMIKIIN